ncbi:JAB domain-containing protein, partial [Enterococcus gallinarum]
SNVIVTNYLVKCESFFRRTNQYHPSGSPQPSQADITFTKRLMKCGELMGIDLLDHLIIGNNSYISLREEGLWEG